MKTTNNNPEEPKRGSFLFLRRRHFRRVSGDGKPTSRAELLIILAFGLILAAFAILIYIHVLRRS